MPVFQRYARWSNDVTSSTPQALPATVAWLGYGGLLPFLLLLPTAMFDAYHADLWSQAFYGYAAVILSFVGALHWGFAIALPELGQSRRNSLFAWSVVPALIAWPALLLVPLVASALLVAGFLLHYWQDCRLVHQASLPAWYLPLRFRLTLVACLSLVVGGFLLRGW